MTENSTEQNNISSQTSVENPVASESLADESLIQSATDHPDQPETVAETTHTAYMEEATPLSELSEIAAETIPQPEDAMTVSNGMNDSSNTEEPSGEHSTGDEEPESSRIDSEVETINAQLHTPSSDTQPSNVVEAVISSAQTEEISITPTHTSPLPNAPEKDKNVDDSSAKTVDIHYPTSNEIIDIKSETDDLNSSAQTYMDEEYEEEDDHEDETDYSALSKADLLRQAKDLAKTDDVQLAYKTISVLRKYITTLHENAKQEALQRYLNDGGEPDGFEFKDEEFKKFEEIYRDIAKKRKLFNAELFKEREKNFRLKNELLDKLRKLSEQEDSKEVFEKVKEIQSQWKAIGPVHGPQSDSLYRSYHTLIDIYYNNHSIYRGLIELDRKHNLQAKKEIIEQAKALLDQPFRLRIIKQLNHLQDEFRSIGSVPNDQKEEIWNEFKKVCDQLYERKRVYLEEQKEALQKEIELKTVLVERAKLFSQYHSEKAVDWIQTTKEVQELQDNWKNITHDYRSKTEHLSKEFWSHYKKFFQNKNAFFSKLEQERKANLKLKEALCQQVEALQDSLDFNSAVEEIKRLQAEWRKIGAVPIKHKEAIWERFRKAIDTFFERKRHHNESLQQEYQANLKVKEQICEKLQQLASDKNATVEAIDRLIDEFQQAGFVPYADLSKINSKFVQAIDDAITQSTLLNGKEKAKLRGTIHNKIGKNNPEARKSLQKQETNINRRIVQLSHDINVWKNNLEFFAKSKNAQSLKEEFNKKIQLAELELKELKEQQKLLTK